MTCSAASAGSALGCIGRGCVPAHSASPIPLPAECWRGIGRVCPSTMTCAPCPLPGYAPMECRGQYCCAAGSPVRTSALPAGAQGSKASVRAYGPTWRAWCVSADRRGWWLRTFLACEAGARTGCYLTWRLRTTPAGRWWWVLSMPALHTGGVGYGWWRKPLLPTVVARDWKGGSVRQQRRRRACQLNDAVGGRLRPRYAEWMMGFPEGWTERAKHASRRSGTP